MGQVWTIDEPLVHCPVCSDWDSRWKIVIGSNSKNSNVHCYWCNYSMSRERFDLIRAVLTIENERGILPF